MERCIITLTHRPERGHKITEMSCSVSISYIKLCLPALLVYSIPNKCMYYVIHLVNNEPKQKPKLYTASAHEMLLEVTFFPYEPKCLRLMIAEVNGFECIRRGNVNPNLKCKSWLYYQNQVNCRQVCINAKLLHSKSLNRGTSN